MLPGINDGACAIFVASEAAAARFGLESPWRAYLDRPQPGVEPDYMGIGPIFAVRKLLERLKMSMADVGVFELNEAFASQGAGGHARIGPARR